MKIRLLLLFIAALLLGNVAQSQTRVYVFSLDDEIDATTWQYTKRAIEESHKKNADLLMVHLNTYGGALVEADSIRTALLKYDRPTVAFIDHNAASAGSLIALACDSVFMAPGSSMGAASVVDGTGQVLPDKYQSYMRAMMRSTAEHHGKIEIIDNGDTIEQWRRNPLIAEAMVDPRIVVPNLIDSTKVLTFTPAEAIQYGYAEGQATNIEQILSDLDIKDYEIYRFEPTFTDKLLGFFGSTGVRAFLIMIIVAGIYFELQSPGLGFPTAAALIAAALYFLPVYAAGTLAGWVILLFIIGIALILLEIFVIPGFGITGIAGGLAIIIALSAAIIESDDITGINMSSVSRALTIISIGFFLGIGLVWLLLSKFMPKSFRRTTELQYELRSSEGYIGVDTDPRKLIGKIAEVKTNMRPVGKIMVDGQTYEAVSDDGYLDAKTEVKIVSYSTAQLHVKKIETPSDF